MAKKGSDFCVFEKERALRRNVIPTAGEVMVLHGYRPGNTS